MFKFAMFYHVNHFDSTKLAILGLIQIWECALGWFVMEPIHEPKLDICQLRNLRATYLNMIFVDPYVQVILN